MSETSGQYGFPKVNVPESQKDEKYHRQFVEAIIHQSIGSSFDLEYAAMNESVDFFNGLQSGEEFRFLQEAEDGEVLPAQWINFNRIRSRIDILLGELQAKTYQINATTINKDAKARKLKIKEEARVSMRLNNERQILENDYGLPLAPEGQIPQNEDELDEMFGFNFKEKNEIIMEYALRYLAKKHMWAYQRLAIFRDILIMGKGFLKLEVQNSLPFFRRVDPRFMIFDHNATDDFLSDSTFFGEVRYMSLPDAIVKYDLSKEDAKKIFEAYDNYIQQNRLRSTGQFMPALLSDTTMSFFKGDANDLRVMVTDAVWQDYKIIKHKVSKDKYDNEHIKEVKDTSTSGDLISNNISMWRKGTLLGGTLLKNWGEVENQYRDNDAMAESSCPYKACVPHWLNGRAISKVDQLKGLQKLKDITMYNIQLAMSRAGAKGFIYDVSQVPEDWDIHKVLKYLKTAGIAFIDSKKDALPATHNQFQTIDQTISQSVQQYLSISNLIDVEMDAISGINAARQGQIEGQSQAVGVTQSALMQSNLATNVYFSLFNQFSNRVFNYLAGLVKITFAGNEKYSPIIGDVGVDFLEDTAELEFDDFGIFLEETPPILDDLQNFQALVQAALQAGQVSFVDAMRLLKEKDINTAINRFEKIVEKREKAQSEAQAQQAQQQMQMLQAQLQQQTESDLTKIDRKGEYDLQKQQLANQGDMDEVLASGKIGLAKEKIDFTKKSALEKIKANNVARKENANVNLSKKI